MKHLFPESRLYIALLLCLFAFNTKAQYVTIPDSVFANWLTHNGFSQCMVGNQLDTTCGAVTDTTLLFIQSAFNNPIHSIKGVEYFKRLDQLDCSSLGLDSLTALPATLTALNCGYNNLTRLPVLPPQLISLGCQYNTGLHQLPALPLTLTYLDCDNDPLGVLPALPDSLTNLNCFYDSLTFLAPLPSQLKNLNCMGNLLTQLPSLPANLQQLYCGANQLSSLPGLPAGLIYLDCSYAILTSLPQLPATLQWLHVNGNQLISLPVLDSALTELHCARNLLTSLPALPPSLGDVDCNHNNLSGSFPTLPAGLNFLDFSHNSISSMPPVPEFLSNLSCGYNQLTQLPSLRALHSASINCDSNVNLTCLPPLPDYLNISYNNCPITCKPNYATTFGGNQAFDTLPLCGIYNTGGCTAYWNISGNIYLDANENCVFDGPDWPEANIKVYLYKDGLLQQQVLTNTQGNYAFYLNDNYGTYVVQLDTAQLPLSIYCPDSGYNSAVVSAADSLHFNKDFALHCPTGFDLAVTGLTVHSVPRPGNTIGMLLHAGDYAQAYLANCVSGMGGQVQLVFQGPASYVGPLAGCLTPTTIKGDTLTWMVADFGSTNFATSFGINLQIDSNALLGTMLCFAVNITPLVGDYRPANNAYNYCLTIVNSMDPNEKEVSPPGNIDTAQQWLTYTIRFQNTGNAEAINIKVTDTLNTNIEPATFQLLDYSIKPFTQVLGNVVVFNFPNINLADSFSNEPASHGYVQFKVKLKPGLSIGTQVANTANIYFDFNPPVVTNTVTNNINCIEQLPEFNITTCSGEVVQVAGLTLTHSGSYIYNTNHVGTCDSTQLINLNLLPIAATQVNASICNGTGYLFKGSNLTASGSYKDTLQTINGCDSIVTLALVVNTVDTTVTLSGNQLNANQTGAGYQWINCGADVIAGATTESYTPTVTGSYQVAINNNGCTDTSSCYTVIINDVNAIAGAVNFRLYPNPANGKATFEVSSFKPGSVLFITDVTGREITQLPVVGNQTAIETTTLPAGVYLIKFAESGGISTVAKLIVE